MKSAAAMRIILQSRCMCVYFVCKYVYETVRVAACAQERRRERMKEK